MPNEKPRLDKPRTDSSADIAVDSSDEIGTNESRLRMILQRLTALEDGVGHIAKPAPFRLANVLTLAGAIVALAVFVVSSFALSSRIDRVDDRVTHAEDKIGTKLDNITGQLNGMDQRLAHMEGAQGRKPGP